MKLASSIKSFYSAVALLLLLAVSLLLYQRPYYNWDMFPYMALVLQNSNVPFESVHARIYDSAALSMPASDFQAIAARQPVLKTDAKAFQKILKYYTIKPGYNFLVSALHTAGIDLVTATYLPSILCYFIIGWLMIIWLGRMIASPFSQIVTLVLMAFPFLLTTARFSSPDMLCAALCFAGVFLMMESSIVWGSLFFLSAITVRPDAIILICSLCIALHKSRNLDVKSIAIVLVSGIVVTSLILKSPELLKEYLYTTPSYSSSWNWSERITNYGISLRDGLTSVLSSQIILFTVLTLVTLFLMKKAAVNFFSDRWALVVIASLMSIVIHYLFHPVMEDRFLIGNYLIIMMGFCKAISEFFSTKLRSPKML